MLVLDMLFVVSAVLFDMLKARQLACVSKSGQKCPAALSLSSWRAWIEMVIASRLRAAIPSRSPHGERGLKLRKRAYRPYIGGSLSSWRAWIEIVESALPTSGVWSRSPHGERGLKSVPVWVNACARRVALLMESVD